MFFWLPILSPARLSLVSSAYTCACLCVRASCMHVRLCTCSHQKSVCVCAYLFVTALIAPLHRKVHKSTTRTGLGGACLGRFLVDLDLEFRYAIAARLLFVSFMVPCFCGFTHPHCVGLPAWAFTQSQVRCCHCSLPGTVLVRYNVFITPSCVLS
jgi:hypothetical protein